jgi:hypothetical protein
VEIVGNIEGGGSCPRLPDEYKLSNEEEKSKDDTILPKV